MRRAWWWGLMLPTVPLWASEPVHGCFRTAAEAAAGVVNPPIAKGAMDGAPGTLQGFFADGVRRDAMLRRSWAVVRSCEHPERPAVMVELLRGLGEVEARGRSRAREASREAAREPAEEPAQGPARGAMPVMIAGSRVEVVRVERDVRLSLQAVAERSAALGERVRLRVVREAGAEEQFVEGVVRGALLVEMEAAR